MPPSNHQPRRLLFAALCVAALLTCVATLLVGLAPVRDRLTSASSATSRRMSGFPRVILWAWERPERLDFINPQETGVAFLARTIYLRGDAAVTRPRLQPLRVPHGTTLIAVARIESDKSQPPQLSAVQRAQAVASIAELINRNGVRAIQIDFDAVASERAFYRELLFDLRRLMPDAMPLSITALASWCIHDRWLDDLPVDEAVPMLFRMGADERQVGHYLDGGEDFRAPICRGSYGVSTDESVSRRLAPTRRFYLFHTRSWSSTSMHQTIERFLHVQQDS
ncbi:MAG TPA: DUF3142 domain-containing protein [Pyrinomonadaceae bacterium]